MTIEAQYIGVTFRQIASHLKVRRGPGLPKLDSERPRKRNKDGNLIYTDSDAAPTLIIFDADCGVDVGLLLQAGSIVAYTPTPVETTEPEQETADEPSPPQRGRRGR